MNILLCLMVISMLTLGMFHINLWRRYNNQVENIERTEMIIEQIQSIEFQRLIAHVQNVMQGEIIYESGTNVLSAYSNNSARDRLGLELYKTESNLQIIDLRLDDNNGQVVVTYNISYFNSEGEILMSMSADPIMPDRWVLEKLNGEWNIVEISTVWEFKDGELELGESLLWKE